MNRTAIMFFVAALVCANTVYAWQLGQDYGYDGREVWVSDALIQGECGNLHGELPRFLCDVDTMNNPPPGHSCVAGTPCESRERGGWIYHPMRRRGDRWVATCEANPAFWLRCNFYVPGGRWYPEKKHINGTPGIEDNGHNGAHLVFRRRR